MCVSLAHQCRRRFGAALVAAAGLRAVLIAWSFYQDSTSVVKYTDIDYVVFSDAATCLVDAVHEGCSPAVGPLASRLFSGRLGDPYARDTYRYTPLLALVLSPNVVLHPAFGKILFASADLLVGVLLHQLSLMRGVKPTSSIKYVSLIWLLNPIVANISTRGSAESLLGVLVVSVLLLSEQRRWNAAALLFGLAVHFKIYPMIYGSSLVAAISASSVDNRFLGLSWHHVRFGLLSFMSFISLNAVMYALWGQPFIEHTYLYHLRRLDHRHNFSPYFYTFYLSSFEDAETQARWSELVRHPLAAFVPQMGLSLALGFKFGAQDLPLAWLLQTLAFVTFNKVCTSQYFLWYLWLLPPAMARINMSRRKAFALFAVWVLSQALWLSRAFRLEMLAEPAFLQTWAAGIVFLLVNCWIMVELIEAFQRGTSVISTDRKAQ